MWGYGDVAMWRYGDVAMWRYGDVAMWRYGDVVIDCNIGSFRSVGLYFFNPIPFYGSGYLFLLFNEVVIYAQI
jgi:hypothetical protein